MRLLRTNTAIRLTVGPFFDETDGVTPQTALTVTNEKLTFMVDDGNVPTLVLDTAPTASGGANDMVHVTGDDAGFYDLELAAANVNYLGRAMLALTNAAAHCPVFHEFMIVPANIYDSLVLGTDLVDVSVVQNAGSAITAAAGIQEVKVASIANNALTAAAINADAITNAKIADDAIAVENIKDGALTAAKIAADAIGASELAADAATEIATAVKAALLATVVSGVAQGDGSGTDTLQLTSGAVSSDDQFNGYLVAIVAGAGKGQQRQVLDTIDATDVIQVVGGDWETAVDSTSVYVLFAN